MNEALENFRQTFGPEALATLFFSWVPSVLAAFVTVLIFAGILRGTTRLLDGMFKRAHLDATAATFIKASARVAILVVGGLTTLNQLGVDTTSVLASLGVAGLTLGFAAQNTLSNIISGIFIFWDRPFVIGDLIEVDGEYGRVETITMRSTRLVTVDGRMLAIPNAVIANTKVASYTNFPHLRIDIDVTIGVTESVDRVREILVALCDGPQFLKTPAPAVAITALNDYNVALKLMAWIEDEKTHITERAQLREAVKKALDTAGVDMPFETLTLAPIQVKQVG